MTPRRFALVALIGIVFVTLVLSPLLLRALEPTAASVTGDPPALWAAPAFALTNQDGDSLTHADLAGQFWIATFGFTQCPGICPAMTHEMKRLHDRYASEDRVRFLFISVDPAHDTPEVLKDYAGQYGADTRRWHFLTGDAAHIQSLSAEGFKVGSVENPMNHSSRFILTGPGGMILGFYDSLDAAHMRDLEQTLDAALARR
jgi:cytochrome oxidase Cu insertion factor (SCO1/SenC/PrrC family)